MAGPTAISRKRKLKTNPFYCIVLTMFTISYEHYILLSVIVLFRSVVQGEEKWVLA